MLLLTTAGGTTCEDILGVFERARAILRTDSSQKVFVFLDEVNTCAHMSLIAEVLAHRTLNSQRPVRSRKSASRSLRRALLTPGPSRVTLSLR